MIRFVSRNENTDEENPKHMRHAHVHKHSLLKMCRDIVTEAIWYQYSSELVYITEIVKVIDILGYHRWYCFSNKVLGFVYVCEIR